MTPASNKMHAIFPREALDKVALAVAFLLGAVGAAAIKIYHVEPEWLAALWSVAVLFGYAVLALMLGQVRIEPETVGDNCYYLGFLFTLSSLAFTLYQLAGNTDEMVMQEIISGFGIALVSTIVGVFLRVLLMQLRADFVARDRAARQQIHAVAREFRGELAASIAELKSFSIETLQLAAERNEKMRALGDAQDIALRARREEEAKAHAEFMRATLQQAAQEAVTGIGKAVSESAQKMLREVHTSAEALDKALTELRAKEAEALAQVSTHHTAIVDGGAKLGASVEKLMGGFDALATRAEAAARSAETQVSEATSALDRASTEYVDQLRIGLSKIDDAAAAGATVMRLEATAQALARPAAALDAVATALQQPVAALERGAAALERPSAALEQMDARLARVAVNGGGKTSHGAAQ